ncbi:MAG: preprotein translocase subunit SecG [Pirellula sp.]
MIFPLAMLSQYIFGTLLFLLSLFIILIILLQRGRGGGLTGALGGAGGASAFGVKAGDLFTRITAIAVLIWIVLCATTCYWYLPAKLNIASDPGSMSSTSSGPGMGAGTGLEGLGDAANNAPPPPSSDLLAPGTSTPAQTSPNAPAEPIQVDLPPASNPVEPTPVAPTPLPDVPKPDVPKPDASTNPAL